MIRKNFIYFEISTEFQEKFQYLTKVNDYILFL